MTEAAAKFEPIAPTRPLERRDGACRAWISRLTLSDFRSHARLEIGLDARPVAITGPNGAGKTNILEAISMLSPGRGLRGARLADLARKDGSGGWAVSARLVEGGDERQMGAGASPAAPDRRACRIDGASSSGPSAFADLLRLVWLTPAQDRLFVDGAGERRRFLDRMTASHDGAHARIASDYEAAMRQRQKLLDEKSRNDNWLAALERQMAESGVALAAARREMAGILASEEIADAAEHFPASDIALEGDLEAALDEASALDVEDLFADRLRRNRRVDGEAGRAVFGPHRSDLIVRHRAKNQPARECSTGEQKALLIGLVLANARALARRRSSAPLILLLDEIAAHLDDRRRDALYEALAETGFQCFMTGTDASLFEAWGAKARHFHLESGVASEIQN